MKPCFTPWRVLCVGVAWMALALSVTPARAAQPDAALAARIDAYIGQPRFAGASWGIAVASLDDGRTLYAHHADRLLQPASTAKLYTAALALATLGGDYRLPTRLLARDAVRRGRLHGPLVLQGSGDPTLGTPAHADWADQLAAQLDARGIRRIQGDLIADDGFFRGPAIGAGWEAGDLQAAFAAPATALGVDENSVRVTVTPAAAPGQPAQVAFATDDSGMRLDNQLRTVATAADEDIHLYRAPGTATLHAFGTVAAGSAPRHYKLSLPDPAAVAARRLLAALARHRIRVDGALQVRRWPQDERELLAGTRVLAQVLSPPLGQILHDGLKRSQNLYLQNLLAHVGTRLPVDAATDHADSDQRAIAALQALLGRAGIAPTAARIVDGNGLSRRNLTTANALVRVLTYLAATPQAARLRDALPLAGVDGSLAARLRGTAAQNNMRAKTGSMAYVQCLAGYVTSAAGERLVFAIMLNNDTSPSEARAAVDTIAAMLADAGRRN